MLITQLLLQTEAVAKSMVYAAAKGAANLPASAAAYTAGGSNGIPSYTIIPNKVRFPSNPTWAIYLTGPPQPI